MEEILRRSIFVQAAHQIGNGAVEIFGLYHRCIEQQTSGCVLDGTPPRVTGRDALAAFDLSVAATESWRTGTTVTVKEQA